WLASIMVMASCVAVLFGDKIRSQSKPFLYLFQLVAAKDPVHEVRIEKRIRTVVYWNCCYPAYLHLSGTAHPALAPLLLSLIPLMAVAAINLLP
ncbi:hypothetical protein ACEUA0_12035, partial [Aeromonas veronii]